jgi:hypothetical protein
MMETRPIADPKIGDTVCAVPCGYCPFLAKFDGPTDERMFLRPGRRAEFINNMLRDGADFVCHKTAEVDEDDPESSGTFVRTPDSLSCAGARLVLERGDMSSQMMRIEERVGKYNRDAFLARNAKVKVWTYAAIIDEGFDEEDDLETCSVVGPTCEAPAGTMFGDSVERGTVAAEDYCTTCGQPVCPSCMDDDGVCAGCNDDGW